MTNMEMDQTYVANTYARFPVTLTEGVGATLKDENGKRFIGPWQRPSPSIPSARPTGLAGGCRRLS
jgi:hypothetical protein